MPANVTCDFCGKRIEPLSEGCIQIRRLTHEEHELWRRIRENNPELVWPRKTEQEAERAEQWRIKMQAAAEDVSPSQWIVAHYSCSQRIQDFWWSRLEGLETIDGAALQFSHVCTKVPEFNQFSFIGMLVRAFDYSEFPHVEMLVQLDRALTRTRGTGLLDEAG